MCFWWGSRSKQQFANYAKVQSLIRHQDRKAHLRAQKTLTLGFEIRKTSFHSEKSFHIYVYIYICMHRKYTAGVGSKAIQVKDVQAKTVILLIKDIRIWHGRWHSLTSTISNCAVQPNISHSQWQQRSRITQGQLSQHSSPKQNPVTICQSCLFHLINVNLNINHKQFLNIHVDTRCFFRNKSMI